MAENQVKTSSSSEPEMKGWLLKWTNYLKGYQRRWFVIIFVIRYTKFCYQFVVIVMLQIYLKIVTRDIRK